MTSLEVTVRLDLTNDDLGSIAGSFGESPTETEQDAAVGHLFMAVANGADGAVRSLIDSALPNDLTVDSLPNGSLTCSVVLES